MKRIVIFLFVAIVTLSAVSQQSSSRPGKKRQNTTQAASGNKIGKTSGNKQVVKKAKTDGRINGHRYIDLGLSVKWAACNVGAATPSDYGYYYAWGETSTKARFTKDNSKTFQKAVGNIAGNTQFDAARAKWGGKWRMPTKAEMEELKTQCTWTWTTQGGHNGYKITGKNGNSIFLPAAGYRYKKGFKNVGERGYYWCAMPYEKFKKFAYHFYFYSDCYTLDFDGRYYGNSIRPVIE